jgi:hypothetical protein
VHDEDKVSVAAWVWFGFARQWPWSESGRCVSRINYLLIYCPKAMIVPAQPHPD